MIKKAEDQDYKQRESKHPDDGDGDGVGRLD